MTEPRTPVEDPLLGTVLEGTYRIERLVAKGGMGAVYEAFHLRLGKHVAIKVMAAELSANAEALQRFHREAMITSGLGHPNIVQVLDHSLTPAGQPFLAMEFLDGEDLDQRLRRVGRLSAATTVNIVKQVASALSAAHGKGIVHRDLKPANICLLDVAGTRDFVKVLDFGISKVRSSTTQLTKATMVLGTPNYMAPEQAMGRVADVDPRADQWALACIAWECMAGERLFPGEDVPSLLYQVVHETPASLAQKVPDLPAGMEDVLRRALAKRADDRFASVTDFALALEDALAGKLPAAKAPPKTALLPEGPGETALPRTMKLPTTFGQSAGESGKLPASPRARAKWPWLAGGFALAALILAGTILVRRGPGQIRQAGGSSSGRLPTAPPPSSKPPAATSAAVTSIRVVFSTEKRGWLETTTAEFLKAHPSAQVELLGEGSIQSAAAILTESLKPAVWSPADSSVLSFLGSEWQTKHGVPLFAEIGEDSPQPLLLSPLVFVVWDDRAAVLEQAARGPITWKTLRHGLTSAKGWRTLGGERDWGSVKLGHTDPTKSNSGLQALYLMMLETADKKRLSVDDLGHSKYWDFVAGIENRVAAFEPSTGTIMTDMVRFGPSKYDIAVVYEASAISELADAEGRWGKLRVCYPSPTLWSDHPAAVLDAPWVTPAERKLAREYLEFLRSKPAQLRAIEYGFRPADTSVHIITSDAGNPFAEHAERGIRINVPPAADMPAGPVVARLMSMWSELVRAK